MIDSDIYYHGNPCATNKKVRSPDKPCAKCGVNARAKNQSYCCPCVQAMRKKPPSKVKPASERPCPRCNLGFRELKNGTLYQYCAPCMVEYRAIQSARRSANKTRTKQDKLKREHFQEFNGLAQDFLSRRFA